MVVLSACSSKPINRAPVEDRASVSGKMIVTAPLPQQPNDKLLPGSENAGKPGYYTVKPKDTLIAIGLETGQSPKDLARWNNVENPNRIEIGQVLRVVPPVAEGVAMTRPVTTSAATATPIAAGSAKPESAGASATSAPVAAAATAPPAAGDDDMGWIWPTSHGTVLAGFDEVKNKGLDIGGNAGEAVLASADGKVVYAGAGLRGYGNLIILKHNNIYLTAYAHNQTLLVKEDQSVKKGQKIAEMGNSDADRVKLHFEVRRQGKPVDPLKYLPPR
ncbi:MAG: peptidoglycan DD-metalloendopeptidase family protein [Burkholderiales bacterium]|nr:peptidoglycan DD-metalloendopeptidase family protein [Burkholderiales bacterium]MBK7282695.1 peptidoglycan DD-metalloendopeptidase family protein [Burkholderiales bacterium]MBK7314665.1 peptidoglycan DD-metalloendopeptidase family protein [Burkholderiales bacterium]MBL0245420.1 peptidoglycan DD-metalloendopeptidase family protein [Rhodoferax sp.]